MSEQKKISESLTTNVLTAVISLLACLLSLKLVADDALVFRGIVGLIIVLTALLVGLHLQNAAANLIAARKVRKNDEEEAALPSLVRFLRRRDTFIIKENRSAEIVWDFLLESRAGATISELSFPIYVDTDKDHPHDRSKVNLLELRVNDKILDSVGVYEMRQIISLVGESSERPIEYGVARVPVNMTNGSSRCEVFLRLELTNAFSSLEEREFCIIDVPYPTDNLEVEVRPADKSVVAILKKEGPRGAVIEAEQAQMFTFDLAETNRQLHAWSPKGKALHWSTRYPMLGYRYRVWFKANLSKPVAGHDASQESVALGGPAPAAG
jgi:hypothetical protein